MTDQNFATKLHNLRKSGGKTWGEIAGKSWGKIVGEIVGKSGGKMEKPRGKFGGKSWRAMEENLGAKKWG